MSVELYDIDMENWHVKEANRSKDGAKTTRAFEFLLKLASHILLRAPPARPEIKRDDMVHQHRNASQ
eukprot:6231582-Amphidinium_carterae.1